MKNYQGAGWLTEERAALGLEVVGTEVTYMNRTSKKKLYLKNYLLGNN